MQKAPIFPILGLVAVMIIAAVIGFQSVVQNPDIDVTNQSAQVGAVTTAGQIAYWSMNESSGTTVSDSSGNGKTGTISGGATSFSAGKIANALNLNGAGYVTLNSNVYLPTTYTIAGWVRVSSTAGWQTIVAESNTNAFQINDGLVDLSSGGAEHYSNATIPANQWVHLAAVSNGSSVTLYINGAQDSVHSYSVPAMNVKYLGGDNINENLLGSLDDIRLYNRALSASEIQSIYSYTGTGTVTPPTNYTVSVTMAGAGSGTLSSSPSFTAVSSATKTFSTQVQSGNTFTVTATPMPNTNTEFGGWSGACASFGTTPTCTLNNISSNQSSTATFNTRQVPFVSGISVSATNNSVTLTWTTSMPAASQIFYGLTSSYGSNTALETTYTTTHTQTIKNLQAYTEYRYKITARTAGGVTSETADSYFRTQAGPDSVKPSTPTNVTATAASLNQVNLSWTASTDNVGVDGYRIYRCTGTTCTPAGTAVNKSKVTTTTYSDTGLTANTTYRYSVEAYDAKRNVSTRSAIVTVTTTPPVDTQAPSTPTNLTATVVSSSQINLSWTGSTDNVGVIGYKIYRNGVFYMNTGTATTFQNTGLTANTQYSYEVSAYDAKPNESAKSNTATVTTSQTNSTKFTTNQQVRTTATVNVLSTPNGSLQGTQASGAAGSIANVANQGTYAGGKYWWYVSFGAAPSGWVIEDSLVPNTTTYTLAVNKTGTGSGTAAVTCGGSSCASTVPTGTVARFSATPDANSTFTGWSGTVTSSSNPLDVTVSANTTETATFATRPVGTNWYVDGTLTTGNNDGTSWANAWRNFSAINWTNVQPGHTIYISGGPAGGTKTYNNVYFTVGKSGTAGSPITFRAGQDAGHNGMIVFDYAGGGTSNGAQSAVDQRNRSYITWDGEYQGVSHIQFQNLRNIMSRYLGRVFYNEGGDNHIYRYISFFKVNNGISGGIRLAEYNNFLEIAGDYSINATHVNIQNWDQVIIRNNIIESAWNNTPAPGGSGNWTGPDGVWIESGGTIYNNIFRSKRVSYYTSDQHTDYMQVTGNYVKVYNNEFINIGDSGFDFGSYAQPLGSVQTLPSIHDIWLYNNVFRITETLDTYPEYFRFYGYDGDLLTDLTNFKILNNTFIDNSGYMAVRFDTLNGNPTANGMEIKNNIFHNIDSTILNIGNSTRFTNSSFSFGNNVYSPSSAGGIAYRNGSYTVTGATPTWKSIETTAITGVTPAFISYADKGVNNNLHLASTDTAAMNRGQNLTSYCSLPGGSNLCSDKDRVARPSTGAWEVGAYEYTGVVIPPSNYSIMTLISGNGTVVCSGTGVTSCSSVPVGGNVTLTASAGSGYTFSGWSGACSGTSSTCNVTASSDLTVNATFTVLPIAGCTTSQTGVWQTQSIGNQTGSFTVEFDVTPLATGLDNVIGLSASPASAYGDMSAIVRFNDTGTIDVFSGTGYVATNVVNYASGTSYHFRVNVNITAQTYDVYVTPSGGSQVLIGSGNTFRAQASTLNYINSYSDSSSPGLHRLCNVIYSGVTSAPSTKFTIGQSVQITGTANVRSTPSTSGTLLGTAAQGTIGTIANVVGQGVYAAGYYWWQVVLPALTGWVAEINLAVNSSVSSYVLTASTAGTGSGTITATGYITSCGGTCNADIPQNTSVTLNATPTSGTFTSWTGCTSTSGSTCTVNMTSAKTVVATFTGTFSGRTFYIDYVSGSDTNNGTSKTTPWKRAPGMKGFAASYSHSAGDRFVFKGGVTWPAAVLPFTISYSGTQANPDYYGVDGSWYSGASFTKPVFDGNYTVSNSLIYMGNRSYVVLDGFEVKKLYLAGDGVWGVGSIMMNDSPNVTIKNCYVHDWKADPSATRDDAHGGIIGNYPSVSPTNVIIDSCEISNAEWSTTKNNGVAVRDVRTVRNSKIHDVPTAILGAGDIHDNVFYNINYPVTDFDGSYHTNIMYVTYSGTNYIYNNLIYNSAAGTGMYIEPCFGGTNQTMYVYNNVMYGTPNIGSGSNMPIDPEQGNGSCGKVYAYNNTMQNSSLAVSNIYSNHTGTNNLSLLDIRNTHYLTTGLLIGAVSSIGTLISNSNISSPTGGDSNYSLANKYAPQSSSAPTINAGVNLTSLCSSDINLASLCYDTTLGGTRTSKARPTTGAWDVGAYEY